MIVDCHTHVWQRPAELGLAVNGSGEPDCRLAADVSDHMEALKAVDLSLVWGFASRHLGVEVPIGFLGQHVGLHSDRMVGIVGIDPADPAWRDKLFEAVDDWGFQGVTVCPACQDLHPLDSRAIDLYEVCQQRNLPLMFDLPPRWQAAATLPFARAEHLDGVARDFPGLKILVSGFGYPYVDQTLVLLEKFDSVFTDIAHVAGRPLVLASALARACEAGVIDKVLFGSGFPFVRPRQAMAAVYHQRSAREAPAGHVLPQAAVDSLVHRDALAVLGIPRPEGFAEQVDAAAEETVGDE